METTSPQIGDLREQIKANAVLLFPSIVQNHLAATPAANAYLYVPPSSAFEIIVYYLRAGESTRGRPPTHSQPNSPQPQVAPMQPEQQEMAYQAMLVYMTHNGPARAAQGNSAVSVEEALTSLLQATGNCLANKCFALMSGENMGMWRKWGDGFVNEEVVGGGSGAAQGLLEQLKKGGVTL